MTDGIQPDLSAAISGARAPGSSAEPGGESTDAAAAANQQLGKQEFLKLLVTQLRNQNPMNPMKGREMAVQLAQFSSVEQLIQLNDKLSTRTGGQQQLQRSLNRGAAAEMIGDRVLAAGDRVRVPDDGNAAVTVDAESGGRATLEIYDRNGRPVGSRDLGYLEAGRQEVQLESAADGLDAGVYRYDVSMSGDGGEPPEVTTYTSGVVDGVRFGEQGPMLQVGSLEIPLSSIREVSSE